MQKTVVDSVLKSSVGKIADEVASLLGEEFKLGEPRFQTLTKSEYFATPREKCAYTRVSGSGDFSGEAAIVLPLKDAVLLGGTLIMLPADELAEKVKNPALSGEEGDAFGEVGNIIVGAVTAVFEDLYPKKLHFKKTTSEVLIPTKVDLDGEQPFPPGHYHLTACEMKLAGKPLGTLELLFPFELLGLPLPVAEEEAARPTPAPGAEKAASRETQAGAAAEKVESRTAQGTSPAERQAAARVASSSAETPEAAEPAQAPETAATAAPPQAAGVKRALVDAVLGNAFKEIAKDLSDLLGQPVKCAGPAFQPITKAQYLALPRDKGALTHLTTSGDFDGEALLIVRQRDAVLFGGTLIMLPEEELAAKVKSGKFEGEESDAYGEVANIITGALTKILDEQYPRKLHLKRGDIEPLVATKVDPEGPKPFPAGDYYLATCQLALERKTLGELDLLFPQAALAVKFEAPAEDQPAAQSARELPSSREAASAAGRGVTQANAISSADLAALQAAATQTDDTPDGAHAGTVLIVAETPEAAAPFRELLQKEQRDHLVVRFQDNVKQALNGHRVNGIFLVMNQVGEQGFAAAIKIKSKLPKGTPLVMAGPQWTRSDVLKAVRYGARDILVTPAGGEDIAEKITRHMGK
ncbi:hypothetical protein [Geoalkalibacter sp.]|uniref:hypothetical protein n=1 Tax=Geoalkalibacter sp. TaxID=3041440 RepID=UPI00272DD2AF|nr:hypothetical protein [Geoalkalibacter sp.]